MVDRILLFRVLYAHFVGFYVLCFVGKVYPWPRIGLLSLGEAVWDEPAQYISMWAPETTRVVPNRESLSWLPIWHSKPALAYTSSSSIMTIIIILLQYD